MTSLETPEVEPSRVDRAAAGGRARGPVVAIVGGGAAGATVAHALAGCADAPTVLVFEPRALLGTGLAYDTGEPAHRINVPATRMNFDADDADHFQRWALGDAEITADRAAFLPDGTVWPRRRDFGRYMAAQLAPSLAAGRVRHVAARVDAVRRVGGGWTVGAGGTQHAADIVVVATSHPAPLVPAALAAVAADPRLVPDTLAAGALDAVGPDDSVLIVGTGLTMADSIAALDRRGHRGAITAVSRRGQRSRGHGDAPPDGIGDFEAAPARTARALLRRVRLTVREAAADGQSWHGVLDTVRRQGGAIWAALPVEERRRLVRHLRPYWDTHRFRIAPQVEAVLERRIADGSLSVAAARPVAAEATGEGLAVTLRRRDGTDMRALFDVVLVTTGPGHRGLLAREPYLAGLAADGLVQLDPVGLGLACTGAGEAVGRTGEAVPDLFVAGPLARGTFGELMGLTEVARQSRLVAATVEARLRCTAAPTGTLFADLLAAVAARS